MRRSKNKDKYTQNLILGHFTMPLARNLAVAAFMDIRPETAQMQGIKTCDTAYNEGSIISEYDIRSPSISQSVERKDEVPEIIDPLEKRYIGLHQCRNFMSILSATCRKFIISKR
ncbi:Uncharacterised protein [uncultured archaeon]|nr:Uncharacterised protein [uncultured archaeon]